ncbi:hypothetical protein D9M71_593850 [compost metagenome]
MEQETLKGVVALIDEISYLQRAVKQKDERIKYLEDLKGVTEKTKVEKAFLEMYKQLLERNNKLQKAALTLLDLGLEYDYSDPDLFTAIEIIKEDQ